MAERCSYGQLTSEMIRDRLVVGYRDLALSERLQLNPDLTLEKAKTMIRQREAVHTQQQVLKEAESGSSFKGENSSIDFLRGQGTKTKPAGVSPAKAKQTPKCRVHGQPTVQVFSRHTNQPHAMNQYKS